MMSISTKIGGFLIKETCRKQDGNFIGSTIPSLYSCRVCNNDDPVPGTFFTDDITRTKFSCTNEINIIII